MVGFDPPFAESRFQTMPGNSATPWLAAVIMAMAAATAAAAQQAAPPIRHSAPDRLRLVQAQPPAAPAPATPATETPQRTTASYGDWLVQCETQAGPPPQKICDMAQTTQLQGNTVPFSRVALVHPEKNKPVKFVAQVPVNVTIASSVRLQIDDADAGVTVRFARCLPLGCFAEFDLKDDELKKLRAASGNGKLTFADSASHEVAIPVSFNGFAQAFDALAKE
jgi:invasion protein IalB